MLLIFLQGFLIPACASSSPAFLMMYSAYKLNKQGDNIQPWHTPFPIWNQSVVPCQVLTVAFWPAYRFPKRQVRWSGMLISSRIFQFVVIHIVKGTGIVNKAEIHVFLELSSFFDDPMNVGNLISGSSAFSKMIMMLLGRHWGQYDKGTKEDDKNGWYHWLNEHESKQTLGDSEGQESLVYYSPWDHRVKHDWGTEQQMNSHPKTMLLLLSGISCVQLCATPKTAAHQAPLSLGFSRQEWSGLPFPSPMYESEKPKWSRSVVSDSSRPHGLQPTRLLRPWDFPGKRTGVGRQCLLRKP